MCQNFGFNLIRSIKLRESLGRWVLQTHTKLFTTVCTNLSLGHATKCSWRLVPRCDWANFTSCTAVRADAIWRCNIQGSCQHKVSLEINQDDLQLNFSRMWIDWVHSVRTVYDKSRLDAWQFQCFKFLCRVHAGRLLFLRTVDKMESLDDALVRQRKSVSEVSVCHWRTFTAAKDSIVGGCYWILLIS